MQILAASLLMLLGEPAFLTRENAIQHMKMVAEVGLTKVKEDTWETPILQPDVAWTELIASWDISGTETGGQAEIVAKVGGNEFRLGTWGLQNRTSQNDQKNEIGSVFTDTLVLNKPDLPIQLQLRLKKGTDDRLPNPNWLKLCFSAGVESPSEWDGKAIEPLPVPVRAQGDYPGGNVLCSPTSVSMVLWYWSQQLKHPELDADVPDVQRSVFDPAWDGTGNWSFNTAFATTKPGVDAYVARLGNTDELDQWIRAGVPVISSVSYDLLKGKESRGANDGHLVVVVGVNEQGDYIFNDPGKKPNRLVYKRDAFVRAWMTSKNTVYLIHPTKWRIPNLL